MKKLTSALIIAMMLACNITLMNRVAAIDPPGSLIWFKTVDPTTSNDYANGVAVDNTGVYIVGTDQNLGGRWRIEKRSLTDGSRIWVKKSNPSSSWEAYGVAVDLTGVYIVGNDMHSGDWRWRIEKRSTTDGSIIWKKFSNPSSDFDEARGVAVDLTGVYIVGYDTAKGNPRWRIEKRNPTDGSLIWVKTSNPSSGSDWAYDVAVDGTSVYIVGYDSKPATYRWRIEKRSLTDGSLIWKKTPNPSISGNDQAYGVAVSGSYVITVGYDYIKGKPRWRMEGRSTTDGSRIWVKTSNPTSSDKAQGVAVDGTSVYIVGYDGKGRWRIEKRSLTDGSRTWTKFSNPSSNDEWAYGVAVDGTGIYIVGTDYSPGNHRWRIEKRHL